jgi:HsdM N-terminal domain
VGFEATLWAAADKLRGHMDAAECKHVVLGLVFLKYISEGVAADPIASVCHDAGEHRSPSRRAVLSNAGGVTRERRHCTNTLDPRPHDPGPAPCPFSRIMRMVSDEDTAVTRRFVEDAKDALRFLHDDFGFVGPCVGQGPFAVWVNFKGAATGVKATFDTLDRVVEVLVVKLVDGQLPPYDETESTHYVDVVTLASLRGETVDLELRSLSGEALRRILSRSAEVVKGFGDILRGDLRRFDQAIGERRAHISRLEADYQRELASEETRSLRRRFSRWFGRLRR